MMRLMAGVILGLTAPGAALGQVDEPARAGQAAHPDAAQPAAAQPAAAQPEEARAEVIARALEPELPVPRWTVEFRPLAWYVAPGGLMRLPGASRAADETRLEDIDLDNPRLSPMAEVHIRQGEWRFTAGGMAFLSEHDAFAVEAGQVGDVVFAPGDALRTRLEFTSLEGTAGYRLIERAMNPLSGIHSMIFALDVVGGARLYDVSAGVERPGISGAEDHEFFAEPIVGVKVDAELYKQFTIDFQAAAGLQPLGDRNSWSLDIVLGGTWRPIENTGVRIGFRQLLVDLQDGDGADEFRFRGALAGLYAGLEVRF